MFTVTSQQVNCGPCVTASYATQAEASDAFDAALSGGAIFAELYDEDTQCQLRVEYPRLYWV